MTMNFTVASLLLMALISEHESRYPSEDTLQSLELVNGYYANNQFNLGIKEYYTMARVGFPENVVDLAYEFHVKFADEMFSG